jgi:hypothetical protein
MGVCIVTYPADKQTRKVVNKASGFHPKAQDITLLIKDLADMGVLHEVICSSKEPVVAERILLVGSRSLRSIRFAEALSVDI